MQQNSSKFTQILLGIIAIALVIIIVLLLVQKNNIPEDIITDQDYDELAMQVHQQQAEDLKMDNKKIGLITVDKSDGNPSARSADRFAIIQTDLDPEVTRPICGSGNEFVSPCIFSLERNTGEIIKVGEWPTRDIITQHSELFTSNNLYIDHSVLLDDTRIFFDSSFEEGCASKILQHWYFDTNTKIFKLQKTEKIINKNGC